MCIFCVYEVNKNNVINIHLERIVEEYPFFYINIYMNIISYY